MEPDPSTNSLSINNSNNLSVIKSEENDFTLAAAAAAAATLGTNDLTLSASNLGINGLASSAAAAAAANSLGTSFNNPATAGLEFMMKH
uniref:Uncharacterized protein n=1 Tax=Panagrolaimus sp. ES5 TaxID=591445 RepID=A0AC34G7U3_9BILA